MHQLRYRYLPGEHGDHKLHYVPLGQVFGNNKSECLFQLFSGQVSSNLCSVELLELFFWKIFGCHWSNGVIKLLKL